MGRGTRDGPQVRIPSGSIDYKWNLSLPFSEGRRANARAGGGLGCLGQSEGVGSPQTLSEADRRIVADWAADCAQRVLWLCQAEAPRDSGPRDAIARTRAFARGDLDVAEGIRRRFDGGGAAREGVTPSAAAAAKAAGQAAAIPHMGAHALGAAAYAAMAAGLAAPDRTGAVTDEIQWQLSRLSPATRTALWQLPPVGENRSGPLGPGLLASGRLGTIIRELQAGLARAEAGFPRRVAVIAVTRRPTTLQECRSRVF